MADLLPPLVTRQTDTPAPLEGQDVPASEGAKAQFGASFMGTLGVSLEAHTLSGGITMPHEQAVATMKANGYDASVLPDGEVSQGYLDAVMHQQGEIQRDNDMAARAHLGGVTQFVSSMAGALSDPLFLALGPLGKIAEGAGAAVGLARGAEGATLGIRAAKGAAEGAGVIGGYETAQKFVGTGQGDRDITAGQIVHDATIGAIVGGFAGGAFGQRPVAPADVSNHVDMIRYAENTAGFSKAHGIPVNEVTSRTGAVGEFQIEPATAKQYMGKAFDVFTLKDPEVNRTVAEKIIRDLDKRFNGDPEAVAVAYNAGPGVAERFVKAGHDRSMLPAETRAYLARIDQAGGRETFGLRGTTPEATQTAAKVAVLQAANDSTVHVEPILSSFGAAKDADFAAKQSDLATAIPKAGSAIASEPNSAAMLDRVNGAAQAVPKANVAAETNPETALLKQQSADAITEAEHAHQMANGIAGESGFTTAKGSGYVVHEDGTTTRNKSYHPEHGAADQGQQPRSEATIFVKAADAEKLSLLQTSGPTKVLAPLGDGRWGVKYTSGKDAGKFEERSVITPAKGPAKGLTPVESFKGGTSVHFGNEITEIAQPNTTEELKTALAKDDEAIAQDRTLAAAVDAAVRCGAMKGLE